MEDALGVEILGNNYNNNIIICIPIWLLEPSGPSTIAIISEWQYHPIRRHGRPEVSLVKSANKSNGDQ